MEQKNKQCLTFIFAMSARKLIVAESRSSLSSGVAQWTGLTVSVCMCALARAYKKLRQTGEVDRGLWQGELHSRISTISVSPARSCCCSFADAAAAAAASELSFLSSSALVSLSPLAKPQSLPAAEKLTRKSIFTTCQSSLLSLSLSTHCLHIEI